MLFRPKAPKQSSMEWLVSIQRGWRRQTLAYLGLAVLLFLLMKPSMAIVTLLSAFWHELGHAAMLEYSGIKTSIITIFPLGMAAVPINRREDYWAERLPYWKLIVMIIAGPLFNLILLLFGAFLSGASPDRNVGQLGNDIFWINLVLLLTNFFPIWKTDGGLIFRIITYSLHHQPHIRRHCMMITAFACWLGILALIVTKQPIQPIIGYIKGFGLLAVVVAVFGAWHWCINRNKNAFKSTEPKMLNQWQIMGSLFAYFSILIVAFASW